MKTKIFALKAYHGDCFLIKTFDNEDKPFNILIDGGPPQTFTFAIREALEDIGVIHLFVLTHIDSDHIGGLISLMENSLFDEIEVREFWVNCYNLIPVGVEGEKITFDQAITLEQILINKNVPRDRFQKQITSNSIIEPSNGINFEILSPTMEVLDLLNANWPELSAEYFEKLNAEPISCDAPSQLLKGSLKDLAAKKFKHSKNIDKDIFNSSSIAFLIKGLDFSFLFLADSRAEIVEENLRARGYNTSDNKVSVDFVKISHHGSKNNTSNDLLDLIDCDNFVISTNGGIGTSKHPDRETIARILYHPQRDSEKMVNLFFNYPLAEITQSSGLIFSEDELVLAKFKYYDDVYSIL